MPERTAFWAKSWHPDKVQEWMKILIYSVVLLAAVAMGFYLENFSLLH